MLSNRVAIFWVLALYQAPFKPAKGINFSPYKHHRRKELLLLILQFISVLQWRKLSHWPWNDLPNVMATCRGKAQVWIWAMWIENSALLIIICFVFKYRELTYKTQNAQIRHRPTDVHICFYKTFICFY